MKWSYAAENAERAYFAVSPTLMEYDSIHGEKSGERWILLQIMALFGASSSSDKGIIDGLPIFAANFAASVKVFKLSELMLFFARYKAGRYDDSYSAFDARRIGHAFFYEFLQERRLEISRFQRERDKQKCEDMRFVPPEGYTSLSWYLELKKRAKAGDAEAVKLLNYEKK